jgi:hypothetical protein
MSRLHDCDCDYMPVKDKPFSFICFLCKRIHECGALECQSLFYNSDFTKVCTITGLCFEQRICETYVDPNKSLNSPDEMYIRRTKRDQQIKNRGLERNQVMRIIKCASVIVKLSEAQNNSLCIKILALWDQFVINITKRKEYVHRKDRRCFVVAIVMSLKKGIMNDDRKFIVLPHTGINIKKLNKKSDYTEFNVSDIRYGQTLIKRVFSGTSIDIPLSVYI